MSTNIPIGSDIISNKRHHLNFCPRLKTARIHAQRAEPECSPLRREKRPLQTNESFTRSPPCETDLPRSAWKVVAINTPINSSLQGKWHPQALAWPSANLNMLKHKLETCTQSVHGRTAAPVTKQNSHTHHHPRRHAIVRLCVTWSRPSH